MPGNSCSAASKSRSVMKPLTDLTMSKKESTCDPAGIAHLPGRRRRRCAPGVSGRKNCAPAATARRRQRLRGRDHEVAEPGAAHALDPAQEDAHGAIQEDPGPHRFLA